MNAQLSQNEFDMLLRQDLATFIHRSFLQLDPQSNFSWNWHLDLLVDRLTQVYEGKNNRLIINVPPRSLKSITASVAFPAWVLGKAQSTRLICVSYGQELAAKMARDCQSLMLTPWYQRAFAARLSGRSATADFETQAKGGRMATSVGGVLTGRGGDIIIIDDPVKPDEALSDAQRQGVNAWYDNSLYSRLNDKREGAIILIMQRLHLDDLVGHVLGKEPWEIVSLPAIAQEREVWTYQTLSGRKTKIREPGDLLHPEREGQAQLDAALQNMGGYGFSAQYLQSPVPQGGALIKLDWLHPYEPHELPQRFDSIVQSWDTASKATEMADYSVCTTWGIKEDRIYLLHVLRKRMDYPELKRTAVQQQKLWKATVVLIEDKASGTQLIQELRAGPLPEVRGVSPDGDKFSRMNAQTPQFENGFIRLPRQAPWLEVYIHELTSFPASRHKDQVDSTSQALAWIAIEGREPGIITYYVQEAAKKWNCSIEEARERLKHE